VVTVQLSNTFSSLPAIGPLPLQYIQQLRPGWSAGKTVGSVCLCVRIFMYTYVLFPHDQSERIQLRLPKSVSNSLTDLVAEAVGNALIPLSPPLPPPFPPFPSLSPPLLYPSSTL